MMYILLAKRASLSLSGRARFKEVLLIHLGLGGRWIIPKGWPIKGLTPPESAAREAFEEAGVRGLIGKKSVGRFVYDKALNEGGGFVICEVTVFPLKVTRQHKSWPESMSLPCQSALNIDPLIGA